MWDAIKLHDLKVTVIESVVTAGPATTAVLIGAEIWTMSVGRIAHITRSHDLRNGLISLGCVVIGLLGAGTAATFRPVLGSTPAA